MDGRLCSLCLISVTCVAGSGFGYVYMPAVINHSSSSNVAFFFLR